MSTSYGIDLVSSGSPLFMLIMLFFWYFWGVSMTCARSHGQTGKVPEFLESPELDGRL